MGSKSDPNKAAMDLQREQMKRLEDIDLPQLEEFILKSPELVGLLDAEQLEDTELKKLQEDPRLREAQMDALRQMEQLGEVGLTPEERAQRSEMLRQGAAQEQARQKQILQGMAQRGSLDSGASLLAQLQSSAAAGADARRQSEQMAADVAARRRQALGKAGSMASTMSAEDFRRGSMAATAQDRIAQFNAMQRADVNRMNLAARQNIANQKAAIANQQAQVANMIAQQRYQNQLSRATGQGQVTSAMSTLAANAPQRPGALQAGLAGAATGAATGAAMGAGYGPWGAAIGGGIGLLSSLEDGGVVHASGGYRVPGILTGTSRKDYRTLDMNNLPDQNVQDAILKREEEERKEKEQREREQKLIEEQMQYTKDLFSKANTKEGMKELLKKGNAVVLGVNTDKVDTFQQGNTDEQGINSYRDFKAEQAKVSPEAPVMLEGDAVEDKKMNPEALEKALAGISKIMGEAPERRQISLPSFSPIQVQNAMKQMGDVNFSNPFAAEDGGLYQGTEYAEDGTVMFDSDGQGAIVGGDSYERDRVDARLNSGEAVLNAAQQQRLLDLLRGKESVDSLGDDDIIEGVPKSYHDELKSDVDKKIDIKQKGLEKLLQALGE